MKKKPFILLLFLIIGTTLIAQPERVGAGLSFKKKVRFNKGDTGNPGIVLKTWIPMDKRRTLHLVPSVTAFNPHRMSPDATYKTTTYVFDGDIDMQYMFYHDRTLKLAALAGINFSYIYSDVNIVTITFDQPEDNSIYSFGPNIGAAVEMRMNAYWDFILTSKYNFGGMFPKNQYFTGIAPLQGLVLQVQGVYYFSSRGKTYYER